MSRTTQRRTTGKRCLIAAAVLILAGRTPARAQSMAGMAGMQGMAMMVSGRVFDDTTGCPLRGAQVAQGDGATHVTTDVNGRYRMTSVPATPFSLRVTLAGYRPRQADSVMVTDTTARVDFSLKRVVADSAGNTRYPPKACQLEPAGGTR
jgi:hypothetical protein